MSDDSTGTELTGHLAERDEPCPLCGYNLRGLQGENCPECGQELTLRVNLVDPVRGAYLVGLIGLACALGFNALLLTVTIILTSYYGDGPPGSIFAYLFVSTTICGGLLGFWVSQSVEIRRRSRTIRILLGALCWLAPILSVVFMCIIIMMFG